MRTCKAALALLAACAAAEAAGQTTAITGATVHTVGPAGTIEDATILIENGNVTAVGTDVSAPAGARTVDASGKIVTPGLFTPFGQIGLVEVDAVEGTVDYVQRGDRYGASFDVADAYNPRSTLVPTNRIEGITQALIAPEAAEPDELGNRSRVISGLASVVQLSDEDWLVRRGAVMVANLGETGSAVAAGSRAAAMMALEMALADARDFAQNREAFLQRNRRDYSVSYSDLEALQAVVDGSIPLLLRVHRASDISAVIGLARDHDVRVIIMGGTEAWLVARELASAGIPVILDALTNLPQNFDRLSARLDSPALLSRAGVRFAIGGGGPNQNHNARNITQAAGIAVANGLSKAAALEAVTLAAAEIYGVGDRLGSIEQGKRANLIIWDNDPLELTSFPDQVLIGGEPVPMESRQTLLRDRYLEVSDTPPAFR